MKINDIDQQLHESINENPANFFNKMGNKILSKMGSNTASGRLQTQQQVDALYKEVRRFAGSIGNKDGVVNSEELFKILQTKEFDPSHIEDAFKKLGIDHGTNTVADLNKDQVRKAITLVVQLRIKDKYFSQGQKKHQDSEQDPAQEPETAPDPTAHLDRARKNAGIE